MCLKRKTNMKRFNVPVPSGGYLKWILRSLQKSLVMVEFECFLMIVGTPEQTYQTSWNLCSWKAKIFISLKVLIEIDYELFTTKSSLASKIHVNLLLMLSLLSRKRYKLIWNTLKEDVTKVLEDSCQGFFLNYQHSMVTQFRAKTFEISLSSDLKWKYLMTYHIWLFSLAFSHYGFICLTMYRCQRWQPRF